MLKQPLFIFTSASPPVPKLASGVPLVSNRATPHCCDAPNVTAEQAREWGLVYKVADPVVDAAREIAQQLAKLPTRALGLTKRGFNQSLGIDLEKAMAFEEDLQREAGLSGDYKEGVKAFLEKRQPVYTGK